MSSSAIEVKANRYISFTVQMKWPKGQKQLCL